MMCARSVIICTGSALMFAACTGSVSPSQLEPPAAVLLSPPAKLSPVKEGDDAIKALIETRRKYASIADRHKRLQTYVNTILGKR